MMILCDKRFSQLLMTVLSNPIYIPGIQTQCQQITCDDNMFCNGSSVDNYKWTAGYKCESCLYIKYKCDLLNNTKYAIINKRAMLFYKDKLLKHHRLCHTKGNM